MSYKLILKVNFDCLPVEKAPKSPEMDNLVASLGKGDILVANEYSNPTIETLRDCIREYDFVRIVTHIVVAGEKTSHISQLHLNIKARKAYYIDSARQTGKDYINYAKSLEVFLRERVGFDCSIYIPSFDENLDSIQGRAPTCAGWTLFILDRKSTRLNSSH